MDANLYPFSKFVTGPRPAYPPRTTGLPNVSPAVKQSGTGARAGGGGSRAGKANTAHASRNNSMKEPNACV